MGRKATIPTYALYKEFIDVVMQDLGLTNNVELDWYFGRFTTMGGDALLYDKISDLYPRYGVVRVSTLYSHEYTINTIMHELRHIWQYYTGILQDVTIPYNKYKVLWNGILYDPIRLGKKTDLESYINQPWEIDARIYADQIERLFPNYQIPPKKKLVGVVGTVKFYKIAS